MYDVVDGKRSYSLHGMTERQDFLTLIQQCQSQNCFRGYLFLGELSPWLLWCLEYFNGVRFLVVHVYTSLI